jgi:hypothetical protein
MLIGRSRISGALLFHAGRCLSAFLLAAAFEREFPINAAAFRAGAVIRARRRDSLEACDSR